MRLPGARRKEQGMGWMTRFQIAHHDMMPVGHPLMVSKLPSLPSHAHPQQQWRDAGDGVLLQGQRQDSDL